MTEDLKKRLLGATVLISLAIIFIPMLLEEETIIDSKIYRTNIPDQPKVNYKRDLLTAPEIEQKKRDLDFGTTIEPEQNTKVIEQTKDSANNSDAKKAAVPVKMRVGLSSWMIQVASFSNQDNALKLTKQLRTAGYDTHLETAQVNSTKVFRVRVGPEISRDNADKISKEISKKFFLKSKVVQYP